MKKLLIVAAHPDDEVLGCGATISKYVYDFKYKAHTLILGEGVTSRDNTRDTTKSSKQLSQLSSECKKANEIIGVSQVYQTNFPDQRFDSVDLLDIVKAIEKHINKIKPEIIFTHFENDINIDHRLTYLAVMAATRPMPGSYVKEIYSFEVLSSTEWSFPLRFSPNFFVEVNEHIDTKIAAMKAYQSELRKYPHPRSIEGIRQNAKLWGTKTGLNYIEAFICIRKFL